MANDVKVDPAVGSPTPEEEEPSFDDVQWTVPLLAETLADLTAHWKKRVAAMHDLVKRCIACVGGDDENMTAGSSGGGENAELVALLAEFCPKFSVQVRDRRSSVVKEICEAISTLVRALYANSTTMNNGGFSLTAHIPDLFDDLLANVKVTIKVIAQSSDRCAEVVAATVPDDNGYSILRRLVTTGSKHRSPPVRAFAMKYLRLRLQKFALTSSDVSPPPNSEAEEGEGTPPPDALSLVVDALTRCCADQRAEVRSAALWCLYVFSKCDSSLADSIISGLTSSVASRYETECAKEKPFENTGKKQRGAIKRTGSKLGKKPGGKKRAKSPRRNRFKRMAKKSGLSKAFSMSMVEVAVAEAKREDEQEAVAVNGDSLPNSTTSTPSHSPPNKKVKLGGYGPDEGTSLDPNDRSMSPTESAFASETHTQLALQAATGAMLGQETIGASKKSPTRSNAAIDSVLSDASPTRRSKQTLLANGHLHKPSPTPTSPASASSSTGDRVPYRRSSPVPMPAVAATIATLNKQHKRTLSSRVASPRSSMRHATSNAKPQLDADDDVDMRDASPLNSPKKSPSASNNASSRSPSASDNASSRSSSARSNASSRSSPVKVMSAVPMSVVTTPPRRQAASNGGRLNTPPRAMSMSPDRRSGSSASSSPRQSLWAENHEKYARVRKIMSSLLALKQPRFAAKMLAFLLEDYNCAILMEFLSRIPPDIQVDLLACRRFGRSRQKSLSSSRKSPSKRAPSNPGDSSSTATSTALLSTSLLEAPNDRRRSSSYSSLSRQESIATQPLPSRHSSSVAPQFKDFPSERLLVSEVKSGKLRLKTFGPGEHHPGIRIPATKARQAISTDKALRCSYQLLAFLSPDSVWNRGCTPLREFLGKKAPLILLNILSCWCPDTPGSSLHAGQLLVMLVSACPRQVYRALRHDSVAYLFKNFMFSCVHTSPAARIAELSSPHVSANAVSPYDTASKPVSAKHPLIALLCVPQGRSSSDLEVLGERIKLFYDLADWKFANRLVNTACSSEVSDEIADGHAKFLCSFLEEMASQTHAELLLDGAAPHIVESLLSVVADRSNKYTLNRRLSSTRTLVEMHKHLSSPIIRKTRSLKEVMELQRTGRWNPSLSGDRRNRFFSALPKCLAAFRDKGSLLCSTLSSIAASSESSGPMSTLFFALFQLLVTLCTQELPHFQVLSSSAQQPHDTDASPPPEPSTATNSAAEQTNSRRHLPQDDDPIEETREVIDSLRRKAIGDLRHDITKAIPVELWELMVRWAVEHSQSGIFMASLNRLLEHVADTSKETDVFLTIMQKSKILELVTSKYTITDENRTSFHGFAISFGTLLLELSDPSFAPPKSDPNVLDTSSVELLSQCSASSEPVDPDRDIDMVDAMTTEKVSMAPNMNGDTAEGKENVPPSRSASNGAQGHSNSSTALNGAENNEKMSPSKPLSTKDATDANNGRPLVPWLAELLEKSPVWQKFLPELRKQYERQHASIYPPLPPEMQVEVLRRKAVSSIVPPVADLDSVDGIGVGIANHQTSSSSALGTPATSSSVASPSAVARHIVDQASAIEKGRRLRAGAIDRTLDANHKREKANRNRLLRQEITPEAYELLTRMGEDDLEDDPVLTQAT